MRDNLLVVINNDKICKDNNEFFSNNYNLKILPEGLNNYHKVEYIARKSNKKGSQKINLQNIRIASNIIKFIYLIFSTFKNKNSKYFITSINPYTFISFIFLIVAIAVDILDNWNSPSKFGSGSLRPPYLSS